MGVVYEAEQVSLGRHVALKVLPPRTLREPNQRRRFEREAKAAARLHHTNIVPVFGVGEHGGTPFYAMQFIAGQGLDAVLTELRRLRGLSVAEAAAGTEGVTEGGGRDIMASHVAQLLLTGRLEAATAKETETAGTAPGVVSEAEPAEPAAATPVRRSTTGRRPTRTLSPRRRPRC